MITRNKIVLNLTEYCQWVEKKSAFNTKKQAQALLEEIFNEIACLAPHVEYLTIVDSSFYYKDKGQPEQNWDCTKYLLEKMAEGAQFPHLKGLKISGVDFQKNDRLIKLLLLPKLEQLDLSNCNLLSTDLLKLIRAMKQQTITIKKLLLEDNAIAFAAHSPSFPSSLYYGSETKLNYEIGKILLVEIIDLLKIKPQIEKISVFVSPKEGDGMQKCHATFFELSNVAQLQKTISALCNNATRKKPKILHLYLSHLQETHSQEASCLPECSPGAPSSLSHTFNRSCELP